MITLLHLSDPHFGKELVHVCEALADLAAHERPAAVIVSGDITQRARRAQFEAAARFLRRLGCARTLVIPGNHDIPLFNVVARLCAPYGGYRRAFGPVLAPTIDFEHALVIGVRTTRRHRHVDGEISHAQIDEVSTRLRRARAGQLRVVVTHQPIRVTRAAEHHNLVGNHLDAARAWSTAGADLLLGGHIHLPFVCPASDDSDGTWVVQAGTATSTRVRHDAPNSVNILRYDPAVRSCDVERWDCRLGEARFVPHSTTPLRLRPTQRVAEP